jgi:hypothetical protein
MVRMSRNARLFSSVNGATSAQTNASRIENLKELQKKVEGIYLRSPQYGLGEQI